MDNNVAVIEDKEYVIVTTINNNNKVYLVLASIDNPDDIMLREYIKEDGKEYFKKLESNEEFYRVITSISDKLEEEGGEISE